MIYKTLKFLISFYVVDKLNCLKTIFIGSALLISPKKAFLCVPTVSIFWENEKQIVLSTVNYDVILLPNKIAFVEVGKSGAGFRFEKPLSFVKKCSSKTFIFDFELIMTSWTLF